MAGRPIEILVQTEVEDKELQKLPDALEKVEESLENVSDAGKDTQKDLDRAFDKIEDTSKDVGKQIDKDLTKALEEVKREAKTTGTTVGRELKDGFDKAGRAADDFKDEAGQSGREAAASFTGEFDDIGDFIQETLANGLAGAGPLGAAAGILMAAGFGALYNKIQEDAEKSEARISAMYDDMLASQSKYISESYIMDEVGKISQGAKDAAIKLADAQRVANETGIDMGIVMRAYAGDVEAAKIVQEGLTSAIERNNEEAAIAEQKLAGSAAEYDAVNDKLSTSAGLLENLTGEQAKATEAFELAQSARRADAEAVREYTQALAESQGIVSGTNTAIQENITAFGSQQAALTANNAALAGMAGEFKGIQDAGKEAGITSRQLTNLQKEQAAAFVNSAVAAGYTADEALNLATKYGLIPEDVETEIRADNGDALAKAELTRRRMAELKDRDLAIRTKLQSQGLQADVNAAVARIVAPPVKIYSTFISRAI